MTAEIAAMVADYGYAATFAGMLLEGESIVLLAGAAAQHGLLHLPMAIAVAATGAFLSDNVFFAIGRATGAGLFARFPRLAPAAARANALVDRFPGTAVVVVRFVYGTRAVGPALIGAGSMNWIRFAALDALASALWSIVWASAGFALGQAVQRLLATFDQNVRWLVLGALVAAALTLFARHRRRRSAGGASRSPTA